MSANKRVAPSRPRDIFLGKLRRREVLLERDLAGDARSLHLGTKRLGHSKSNASLNEVPPTKTCLSGALCIVMRVVLDRCHVVLWTDRASPPAR